VEALIRDLRVVVVHSGGSIRPPWTGTCEILEDPAADSHERAAGEVQSFPSVGDSWFTETFVRR
jgi:hypothetical protein